MESLVDRAAVAFGGYSALARALELDRQVVYQWKRNKRIPARYANEIEELSKGKVTAREIIDYANKMTPRYRVFKVKDAPAAASGE